MNALCYNFNEDVITATVASNNQFIDILVSDIPDKYTDYQSVIAATESCMRLSRIYGISDNIVFRYPSRLKGNRQEQIIDDKITNQTIEDKIRIPYSINGAINTMYSRGEIGFTAHGENAEPSKIYTDASINAPNSPTVSVCITDDDDKILLLFADTIPDSVQNIDIAELYGGLLGIRLSQNIDTRADVTWICDNEYVLSVFDNERETKVDMDKISKNIANRIRSAEKNIEYESISGNDNRIADALADDVRREEFTDSIIFMADSIKDSKSDSFRGVNSSIKNLIK